MKKKFFPKIGFRIIKTMIAVVICLLIKFVIHVLWKDSLVDTIFSPFFSAVGACYSLSSNKKDTFKQAQVRSFGSIWGGLMAVGVIYLSLGLNSLFGLNSSNDLYYLVEYILVAIFIIALIWGCVVFRMAHITYISCLTYLCICVGNASGLPTYLFATNRVLSTIFGVLVALVVNLVNIHLYNNKKNILVVTTNGCLLDQDSKLSSYQKYQLNNLAELKAPIYYATTRSSASLFELFSNVIINNPLIIMNGAAIFDFNDKTYSHVVNLDLEVSTKIEAICKENNYDTFTHCILNNMLTIYYTTLTNPGTQTYYKLRKDHFDSFACNDKSNLEEACYYIMIDTKERIDALEALLLNSSISSKINILKSRNFDYQGYYMLKICSSETNKYIALNKIVDIKDNLITFAGTRSDIELINHSKSSFCLKNAHALVKEASKHIIPSSDNDDITKMIKRCYHRKRVD